MTDTLYEEFYDPSSDFLMEPRAFCYDLATQFIEDAKQSSVEDWYDDIRTIKGILLLLFTWNFAARKTKQLTFGNVGQLLRTSKKELRSLEGYSIQNADSDTWPVFEQIFARFGKILGQTGASKALSLLNPNLFVMWDTAIRKRLNKELIPGIQNGQKPEHYIIFLQGIQVIINKYHIAEKLPTGSIVAKKIDEYHYVRMVLRQ